MSSQIHSNPQPRPTAKPAGSVPAKPAGSVPAKPAGSVPAKPAGGVPAKPAGSAAAKPPAAKAPAQPAAASGQAAAEQAAEQAAVIEHRPAGGGFLRKMPAWLISMVVHIIALLAMALISVPTIEKPPVTVITASQSEEEKDFEEVEDPLEEQVDVPEIQQPVAPSDVAVVEDVKVITNADDFDAAPLAVELTDFSAQTAPAADMLSTVGAIGGTGGGFGGRANAAKIAAASGGGADTEQAVDRALKWIVNHQMPDGGWSFDFKVCPSCQGQCSHSGDEGRSKDRCAATAMAILPFLGRGYTHREGPYKAQIERGIAFLAAMTIQGKGKAYGAGGSMYSQGLAGIALSESYGMTQDARLAMPTQLALNFIMDAQDPRNGSWGYGPKKGGDTSIVGWQLMALKSGNMAYLQVNPLTIKKTVEFLDSVQEDEGAFYGYASPGRGPGTSAVGLLCRMYLGWKKDHPPLQRGVAALAKRGPNKDLYFTYYATQILHHMEGDMWIAWNDKMKKLLLPTQATKGHEAGSWYDGVDGGHGAHVAGRLYCTALATMTLEVYYRHLPIYRNQSVDEEFKE
jgi:hypothetical protein